MRRGWRVLAGWGAGLVVLAAVQIVFHPKAIELALLGGAGVIVIAVGALALEGERRRLPPAPVDEEEAQTVAWWSVPSLVLAFGIALFVLGWEVGAWLMGIGGGFAALGLGGLVREKRAERA